MAQLASLEFKDLGFVLRMCRGFDYWNAYMVWPTK